MGNRRRSAKGQKHDCSMCQLIGFADDGGEAEAGLEMMRRRA